MAKGLNEKQRKFCVYYVSGKDTIGNGVQSYALAYDYDLAAPGKYLTAKSNAHKLLSKPEINEYIDKLLEGQGVDDRLIERHVWMLITQNADQQVKRQAIADYLRLGGRLSKKNKPFSGMHDGLRISIASIQQLQDSIDPEEEAEIEEVFDELEERWEQIQDGKVPYPSM